MFRVMVWLVLATTFTHAHAASDTLTVRGNRLFIPVTINGMKVEALLDSAAEMTFIDPMLGARLQLHSSGNAIAKGSGGQAQASFADGVNITAAGVQLRDMTIALIDLTDLSQRLVGRPLQVVLGRELFDAARLEVDIAGGTIRTLDRSRQPRGVQLPLTTQRGVESLPCKVEGIPAQADLDLGNGSEVLVGKAFAQRHGLLQPGRVVERKAGGGIGGGVVRDIVVLASLEIAGVQLKNVRAAIDEQETAGEINVGTSVLQRFVLVIDYSQHAAWLRPR